MKLALFERKTRWALTWRGWLALALTGTVGALIMIVSAYPLLAPNKRQSANVLVVEGWLPEYALAAAIQEFDQHNYTYLVTSGGPLWEGHHAAGFHSYAALAAHVLKAMEFNTNHLHIAPGPKVWRHRTFHSAVAVKDYLEAAEWKITGINVMTLGPHGRRTQIIFNDVLQDLAPVGIISYPSAEYDARRWWRTSEGTKHILTETLAATYEWGFKSGRPRRRPRKRATVIESKSRPNSMTGESAITPNRSGPGMAKRELQQFGKSQ